MKIPIVKQQYTKDCGPCSLQSIIKYYGGYVPLEKIRQDAYTSSKGTSIYHLLMAARDYGFDAIAKKNPDKNIHNIMLPAIMYMKYENGFTHFVVLYKINKNSVVLMDPTVGKITKTISEFIKCFTGIYIELYPRVNVVKMNKETKIFSFFFEVLKANKVLCLNLFSCSLCLIIFTILSGLYFQFSYNNILNNDYYKYLIYVFLFIIILKIIFTYLKMYYENHLNKNIDVITISNFISHVFKLPLNVINTKSSGEIISIVNEMSSIKSLFSEIFISSFLDLLLALITCLVLFFINNKLTLLLIFIVVIYLIITFCYNPYIYKRLKQNLDYQINTNAILIENIDMINSIKNMNKTDKVLNKIERAFSNLLYDNYNFNKNMNVYNLLKNICLEMGIFLINTIGFIYIVQNKLSLISLVTFNTLMMYFIDPIKNLTLLIPKYNFFRASFNKICDFLNINEELLGNKENFTNGDIKFENISFTYNKYHKVINNFSLTINKGEKIIIKGESGSGKSTLCKLLIRNNELNSGNIFINSKNIQDYSLNTLKNNITYVGQKENLFSDTIKNNILFYSKESKEFAKVCKICLIDKIIDKKTFRYDFGIDNSINNISGGEKQRIVLARALMKDSSILILDEALSELDYKLESEIIKNIIKYYPYKTIIYVSHKNQEKYFDRVIYMEKSYE